MAKTIFGLLGYPVKHSLSAAMHNAAFLEYNIDAEYRLFELKPENLKDFLLDDAALFTDTSCRQIRARDVAGFNITVPHKVAARQILEAEFSSKQAGGQDVVNLAGALNTVKREKDSLQYRNTDAPGFLCSLNEDLQFNPKDKTILLLGCGGAGRAVIAGLVSSDAVPKRIYVLENDPATESLVRRHFSHLAGKIIFIDNNSLAGAADEAALIVNTTPVGMHDGDPAVFNKDLLHKGHVVYDVIYNRVTPLVADAKGKGLAACGGLGMLLYQGVIAWEFWTGKSAPVDVMRKALQAALK